MGWVETQVQLVITRVEYLFRWLQDLQNQLRAVQQGLQQAFQQSQGTAGGGTGVYFANNVGLGAASGTWPAITPAVGSYVVYQASAGALSSLGSQTVQNWFPDACDGTKRQALARNADGTFSVINQSCAAG